LLKQLPIIQGAIAEPKPVHDQGDAEVTGRMGDAQSRGLLCNRSPGEYLSECWHDVQSVELHKRAATFVRTKTERISDRNTSESVEPKSGKAFCVAGSVELNSLQSARAAAENRPARSVSCLEQGFK
jgi:hypothetical protein